jgi:hypothetical protein
MRNCVILCSAFLVAVCAMWIITETSQPGLYFRYNNVAHVKKGMTLKEIETLLGVPPGVYTSEPIFYWRERSTFTTLGEWIGRQHQRAWRTDDITLFVEYNPATEVAADIYVRWHEITWWEKIQRRLPR